MTASHRLALAASRLLELVNLAAHAPYRLGLRRPSRAAAPVVSVGNLALGGTGKTPLVAALARELLRAGARPAVLSRGYRREDPRPALITTGGDADWRRIGDEPAMIARLVPGLLLAIDADRRAGARRAVAAGATHLLLDDGFQHWRLARDLDIVVVDARDPFCRRAPRREGPGALRRAGAVVVAGPPGHDPDAATEAVMRRAPRATVVPATVRALLVHRDGRSEPAALLAGRRVLAAAAIAEPARFTATLSALGAEIVGSVFRRDHHPWTRDELDALVLAAREMHAEPILTAKDAVKVPAELAAAIAWLEVGLEPVAGSFAALIAPFLTSPPP
jgi:tetraacyldisaccharide 4'-kinase